MPQYPVHNFGMDKFAQYFMPFLQMGMQEKQAQQEQAQKLDIARAQTGAIKEGETPTWSGAWNREQQTALSEIAMSKVESKKLERQIGIIKQLPPLVEGLNKAKTPQTKAFYRDLIQKTSDLVGFKTDFSNLTDKQVKETVDNNVLSGVYKVQQDFTQKPNGATLANLHKTVNNALDIGTLNEDVAKSILTNANQTMKDAAAMARTKVTAGKEKAGQNWILPDRSTVISYDGGRTYQDATGKSYPMPSTATKIPGGATITELNVNQAKQQAQVELMDEKSLDRQSPKQAALIGTGPYKRVASAFEAVAGGLGVDKLVGQQGFFPDVADAKQYLRSVKQMGKAALMNSSRGAIWEQERIDKLFPDPDRLFTNPRIEARKFKNLMTILKTEKKFNNKSIISAVLPKEIERYRTSNNEIDRLMTLISEPNTFTVTSEDRNLIKKYLQRK